MFVICYTPRTSRTLVKSSMLNENKLLKQLTDFAWQSVYDDWLRSKLSKTTMASWFNMEGRVKGEEVQGNLIQNFTEVSNHSQSHVKRILK